MAPPSPNSTATAGAPDKVRPVNPAPMALWAALIMGFTLLGLGSLLIGLVFVIPMLGHASWHAYRDLVSFPTAD